MKLATYRSADGSIRAGRVCDNKMFGLPTAIFPSVQSIIDAGDEGLASIPSLTLQSEPLESVQLLAPLPRPSRIFGIGLNYQEHATESKMNVQSVPTVFMKLSTSVVGPGAAVMLPRNSSQVDYEAELGVVIGHGGYRISADQAQLHIFGYTIVNDISARDIQLATSQWTLGKSFPTFTPVGPWIVTRDEVRDPHSLSISLAVDGETLQSSNTRYLIFGIPALIKYISSITPLEAGDIISTGTPAGVGLGRTPQRWLRAGEEMVINIEAIGELRNRTQAEKVENE